MNREIKFRCWDKEDNKMLSHEELKDINWSYSELTKENDNYVLMQYTGLKDKNGVEIYEGDISESGMAVCFFEGIFCPYYRYEDIGTDWWSNCKIIGNIYENKN